MKNETFWRIKLIIISFLIFTQTVSASFAAEKTEWRYHDGKGYAVCDALFKRLNKYHYPDPNEPNNCAWNVALSYPGFSQPPWVELDAKGHEELIYRLLRYADATSPSRPEAILREQVRKFIEHGGRVQLWRTRLISDFVNKAHPEVWAPPGLQNVIQLRYPKRPPEEDGTTLCPDVPQLDWQGGQTFIVNEDLTDIHPDIGYIGVMMANKTLVIYQGKTYFLSRVLMDAIMVARDQPTGLAGFCEIRYEKK